MSDKNISKTAETIVSFIILMLLAGVGFAVFYARKGFHPEQIGFAAGPGEKNAGPGFDFNTITGDNFSTAGPAQTYSEDNLYEKINGKAPFYIESGFRQLTTARIASKQDSSLWAEIYVYDMNDPLNAYAVYSGQKRQNTRTIDTLDYGYKTSNSLFFISGRYYVEIIGSKESEKLVNRLENLAAAFAENITKGRSDFSLADLFPADRLEKGSIVLYKKDAFGYSGFENLLAADYQIDGSYLTAFVIKKQSPQQSQKLFSQYKNYLLSSGFKQNSTENKIHIFEYDGIYEFVFNADNFLGGVHEAFEPQAAEKLAIKMYEHLKNIQP